MSARFEATGLSRKFGRVQALDSADFDVEAGEVVALIGDNGAGKSTVVKALTGNLDLDAGEVRFEGQTVHFATPQDASSARCVPGAAPLLVATDPSGAIFNVTAKRPVRVGSFFNPSS